MEQGRDTAFRSALCAQALLISVPGVVFSGEVFPGQGKEREKVLLTGWILQKRRCMASPAAVTSSHISCEVSQLGEIIVLTLALRALNLAGVKEPKSIFSSGQFVLEQWAPDTPALSSTAATHQIGPFSLRNFPFFFLFWFFNFGLVWFFYIRQHLRPLTSPCS